MSRKIEIIDGFSKNIHIATFGNTTGFIVTSDFLSSIVNRFSINSQSHLINEDILPFIYSEKQLHSVLCPAIKDTSKSFLMEAPVSRRKRGENNKHESKRGWVDYYSNYRGVKYFIEVKHSFYSVGSGKLTKGTKAKWASANRQIQSVKREITDWIDVTDKGAFRLSMLFLPYFKSCKSQLEISEKKLLAHHTNIANELKANWSSLCVLNKKAAALMNIPEQQKFIRRLEYIVRFQTYMFS